MARVVNIVKVVRMVRMARVVRVARVSKQSDIQSSCSSMTMLRLFSWKELLETWSERVWLCICRRCWVFHLDKQKNIPDTIKTFPRKPLWSKINLLVFNLISFHLLVLSFSVSRERSWKSGDAWSRLERASDRVWIFWFDEFFFCWFLQILIKLTTWTKNDKENDHNFSSGKIILIMLIKIRRIYQLFLQGQMRLVKLITIRREWWLLFQER